MTRKEANEIIADYRWQCRNDLMSEHDTECAIWDIEQEMNKKKEGGNYLPPAVIYDVYFLSHPKPELCIWERTGTKHVWNRKVFKYNAYIGEWIEEY